MGLSSSQARLLNLSSRMHQIEYKAAKIEAEKLQMANESRRAYLEYQEAMEQTKIQIKTIQSDASVTFVDITKVDDMVAAGFAIVVHDVPCSDVTINSDGEVTSATPAATGAKTSDIVCTSNTLLAQALGAKYNKTIKLPADPADFRRALSNIFNMGDVTIIQKRKGETEFPNVGAQDFAEYQTSVATNPSLQEVDDEKNLRKAEAKYEADMRRIDMKDRKFDYDLAALDAERNAIKQEMETLKTVAKDNVDRTFKLFS